MDRINKSTKTDRHLEQFRDKSRRTERPPIKEIANHVVPMFASTWKRLGLQLNIEEYLLRNIEKDNANDCEGCCSKMLTEWLDMNTDASWGILINALDKLALDQQNTQNTDDETNQQNQKQQNQQQQHISQQQQPQQQGQLGSIQSSPPQNSSESSQISNADSGDTVSNEECRECMLKRKPLTKLKGKFINVVDKIRHIIESKPFKVEDLIRKLRQLIDADQTTVSSTDDTFGDITTVEQLFSYILKYYTYSIYDYEQLEAFLASLDECDEAIKLLDDFTKELEDSILLELDLMSENKDQLKPKKLMKGTFRLDVKYTGKEEYTLALQRMVKRIVQESLHLHKASITFIGSEEGCIAFVYQISAAVKSYIQHYIITPNGLALLALHDIKCLVVDGTEIPIPVEFKEFKVQLDKLLASLSPEDKMATLSTLKKIFNNIIQYPDDQKYHQIKLANERFCSTVWQYPAGEELMKMSGWVVEGVHVTLKSNSYAIIVLAVTSQKLEETSKMTPDHKHATAKPPMSELETKKQLIKQLDKLIASLSPEDSKEALLTLYTYFQNVRSQPHNDSYRQIKLSNKAFCSKVWRHPAGEVFMKMCGWEVEGAYVKLKDDSSIQIAIHLLKTKLEGNYMQKEFQGVLTIEQFESLTSAVLAKDLAEIDRLLQHCGVSSTGRVHCQDGTSVNLLTAAITTQHGDMVELLFDYYGVNPYEKDCHSSNQRPCMFQVFHQAPEAFIIEFFSALGFINVCVKEDDGFTLVHTAVLTNSLEVLSFLFENYRIIRVNDTDNRKRNSLHLAYLYGNTEMAEFLLDKGADEMALDIYGKRPSDYINGDPKLVAYSKYVQNTRKIHDDPYTIEYNYYINLLKLGMDPEKAVSLTMKEFTWLQEERPTRPRRTDQDKILKDLAEFIIDRPIQSVA